MDGASVMVFCQGKYGADNKWWDLVNPVWFMQMKCKLMVILIVLTKHRWKEESQVVSLHTILHCLLIQAHSLFSQVKCTFLSLH